MNQSRMLYYGSLCNTLVQAAREGVISPDQWLRMEHHMYKNRWKISKGKFHFWPLKRVAPRVKACYKLAKLASR